MLTYPPIPDPNPGDLIRSSREKVKNAYGLALAQKATDELCLALADGMGKGGAPAMPGEGILSVVFECERRQSLPGGAEYPGHLGMQRPPPANTIAERRRELRAVSARRLRAEFEDETRALRSWIEDAAITHFGDAIDDFKRELGVTSLTEIAWSNRTVCSWVGAVGLGELAHHDSVYRIGIPVKIELEAPRCVRAIGVPTFRRRHGQSHRGAGVLVGLIDQAVSLEHPALRGRVEAKGNFTMEADWLAGDHGTAVAGLVASDDPECPGVAPEATIYSYKVIPTDGARVSMDSFAIGPAVDRAIEDGVDLLNCSFGLGVMNEPHSACAAAFDTAWELGVPVVKSAGNRGPRPGSMTHPCEAAGVIVVGATDEVGQNVALYSGRGPIAGGPARPDCVAPGGAERDGIFGCAADGGFAAYKAGTSYAAALVSGVLALLIGADREAEPDDLRRRLASCCTPLAGFGPDAQGAGLVNLEAAI